MLTSVAVQDQFSGPFSGRSFGGQMPEASLLSSRPPFFHFFEFPFFHLLGPCFSYLFGLSFFTFSSLLFFILLGLLVLTSSGFLFFLMFKCLFGGSCFCSLAGSKLSSTFAPHKQMVAGASGCGSQLTRQRLVWTQSPSASARSLCKEVVDNSRVATNETCRARSDAGSCAASPWYTCPAGR